MAGIDKPTKLADPQPVTIKNTKKCQPTARAAPDLIKTECSPDSGLSRLKKINRMKKIKTQK